MFSINSGNDYDHELMQLNLFCEQAVSNYYKRNHKKACVN